MDAIFNRFRVNAARLQSFRPPDAEGGSGGAGGEGGGEGGEGEYFSIPLEDGEISGQTGEEFVAGIEGHIEKAINPGKPGEADPDAKYLETKYGKVKIGKDGAETAANLQTLIKDLQAGGGQAISKFDWGEEPAENAWEQEGPGEIEGSPYEYGKTEGGLHDLKIDVSDVSTDEALAGTLRNLVKAISAELTAAVSGADYSAVSRMIGLVEGGQAARSSGQQEAMFMKNAKTAGMDPAKALKQAQNYIFTKAPHLGVYDKKAGRWDYKHPAALRAAFETLFGDKVNSPIKVKNDRARGKVWAELDGLKMKGSPAGAGGGKGGKGKIAADKLKTQDEFDAAHEQIMNE